MHVGITIPHSVQRDSMCCCLLRVREALASPFAKCRAVCPARVRRWHNPSAHLGLHDAAASPLVDQCAIPSWVHFPFSPGVPLPGAGSEGPCCGTLCAGSPALPSLLLARQPNGRGCRLHVPRAGAFGALLSPCQPSSFLQAAGMHPEARLQQARPSIPRVPMHEGTGDNRHALASSCCSCGESADFGSCKQAET